MTDAGSNITIHGGETPEIMSAGKVPKHVTVYDSKDYLSLGMATPLGERAILGSVGETVSEGDDSDDEFWRSGVILFWSVSQP